MSKKKYSPPAGHERFRPALCPICRGVGKILKTGMKELDTKPYTCHYCDGKQVVNRVSSLARKRIVVVESPYSGNVEANVEYARRALKDSLRRGEVPLASHLLYTQPGVLIDAIPSQRKRGMEAGFVIYLLADACVVYVDRGMSKGMEEGIRFAKKLKIPVEIRKIKGYENAVY